MVCWCISLTFAGLICRHWKHDRLEAVVERIETDSDGCRARVAATLHEQGNLYDGDRLLETAATPYAVEYELQRDGPSSPWRIISGRLL